METKKNCKGVNRFPSRARSIRGQVLIMVTLWLVLLLSLVALTLEVGHILIIKSQLQNAADASSLQGALYLYPGSDDGTPSWDLAKKQAASFVPRNVADGKPLQDAEMTTGFWNFAKSAVQEPPSSFSKNTVPCIQVTIRKAPGVNDGPVDMLFGRIIGTGSIDIAASAIAVIGAPASVGEGKLFPLALSQEACNTYWDSTSNAPKDDPKTGAPYRFDLDAAKTGAMTSFLSKDNSSSELSALIAEGNPEAISIGQSIWIISGNKSNVYGDIQAGQDVIVPIVAALQTGSFETVVAFAAIHIDIATKKAFQGHFTNYIRLAEAPLGGGYYGVYTSPHLVK